jgi:hypothetical protein
VKPKQLTWLLRAVVFVHTVLLLAQAVFAGQFLAGEAPALRWHEFNGTAVIMSVALVQCILAVVCWRKGIQALGFAVGSAVLYLAEGAQIAFGVSRRLSIHVPLGVLIFGGALLLCFFTLKPKLLAPKPV